MNNIWSNLNFDNLKDDLREEYPDASENELYQLAEERNEEYLDDQRNNLGGIVLAKPIIAIADLGLWYGHRSAYRVIKSGKISDCLFSDNGDYTTWFVDHMGNFRAEEIHHDGVNHILYRGIKPGISEASLNRLLNRIYNQEEFKSLLSNCTFRLGDLIGDVYGWSFAKRPAITKEGKYLN